jgi:RHS repeat-associated protein
VTTIRQPCFPISKDTSCCAMEPQRSPIFRSACLAHSYTLRSNFGCATLGYTYTDYNDSSAPAYLPYTITDPNGAVTTLTYETTPGVSGAPYGTYTTGRIASITFGSGGSISYAYSQNGDSQGNNGMDCLTFVVPKLTVTANDNNGNSGPYTYVNSDRSLASPNNFTVTKTDPAGNQTVYNFSGEYQTRAVYDQGTTTVLKTVTTCYGVNGAAPPSRASCPTPTTAPSLPITETDVYTSLGTSSYNEVQTKFDATYGNVTYTAAYDFGASAPTTQVINIYGQSYSSPSACTAYPSGSYINNTPCYSHTENSAGTDLAKTKVAYNTDGKPASVSRWTGATENTWLTKSFGYGAGGAAAGVLSSVKDVDNATTTYGNFACNGMLPGSTTYPLSSVGSDSQTWNCNGGVMTSQKDVNGYTTSYTYDDPLWRITSITYPDSTYDTATFSYSTGTSFPWTVTKTKAESATASFSIEQVMDGLGRTVTSETLGDPSGTDYVSTTYNNLGQVVSVSQPYRSGATVYNNTYSYDALGRTTYVGTANGLNKYISYSGRATQVQLYPYWDDKQTIYQSDGLGRLTNVCEVTTAAQQGSYGTPAACGLDIAGSGFLTQYTYDALGNLVSMGQEMNVAPILARDFTYDGLSRLTSEATPEQSLGTTYTYDTLQAGDLYQRVAPLENSYSGSVTSTYTFDAMHRIKDLQYNDSVTSWLWFYYDSADPLWQGGPTVQNPKGRMVEAGTTGPSGQSSGSTVHAFGYDSMGNTNYHAYQPPSLYGTGNYYPAGYTYDFLGKPLSGQNWLAGWNNYYNALGQLTTIWSNWLSPTQNGDLESTRLYNAAGQPLSDTLANGLNETWAYDGSNNPSSYGTGGVSYTYNIGQWLGNDFVVSAYDNIIGQWSYSYDNFGRLATATCSSGNCPYGSSNTPAYSYQYDPVGNRWKQNVTAGTGLSVQASFSYQHNWLVGNSYDVAGNVTNDGNHSYGYDAEGRILQVDGGSTESNIYDALGRIASQTTSAGTSEWVYDLAGHVVAQSPAGSTTPSRVDFWEGGRHWAYSPDRTNLYFIHTDWLGTEKATSNLGLTQGGGCFYLPFGDGATCTSPSEEYFTDQMVDTADSLMISPAREYNPRLAIWMRPDPAGLAAVDVTNPQTWNRYAYVTNNPVSMTDPFGLWVEGGGSNTSGGEDLGGPGGLGDGGCGGFTDGAGSSGVTCGDFTFFLPTIPAIGAISGPVGPSQPPGGGTSQCFWGTCTVTGSTLGCDFGVCNPIGNGFAPGMLPWRERGSGKEFAYL